MDVVVKEEEEEVLEPCTENRESENIPSMENIGSPVSVVELSSDSSSVVSDSEGSTDSTLEPYGKRTRVSSNGGVDDDDDEVLKKKKKKSKIQNLGFVLPIGFLEPLNKIQYLPNPQSVPIPESEVEAQCQPESQFSAAAAVAPAPAVPSVVKSGGCKQFWKAGEYDGNPAVDSSSSFGGMDHVRVHPKFLHSNATSHKWALGAFAELLDNSLDEICHGATFVNVDMLENKKDMSRMLLVEDNGGGMSPDRMRHCMSLGYSAKSKSANTIGQYGNGFKTSTMRLGGDVIVFSRCRGKDDKSPTQSIGLLSYTFLKNTGKEDIVVPMLDYEKDGQDWSKMVRSSTVDWNRNVETVVEWSPYSSEADLLHQFDLMKDQGTRVVIYNLWEDDGGELELDFDTDEHDIQIRGVNRDEKKIEMAKQFPNSRHFLTYRHSLRSYSSIIYLRLPPGFRITLRGQDVDHHNIVNDMMMMQEVTYRPQFSAEGASKDPNMVAVVKLGFVKDAKDHIDVQGFNVYHKNRLIKPFWRVWNAAGSDGRGVIGVLEANFVEPAHDKQGFERTTVLSRLEQKLVQIQKTYWSTKCHEIGYAPRRNKKKIAESSAENVPQPSPQPSQPSPQHPKKSNLDSTHVRSGRKEHVEGDPKHGNGPLHHKEEIRSGINTRSKSGCLKPTSPSTETMGNVSSERASPVHNNSEWEHSPAPNRGINRIATPLQSKGTGFTYNGSGGLASCNSYSHRRNPLEIENQELKDRLNNMEVKFSRDLQFERDKCKFLENQVNGVSPSSSDALLYQFKVENHDLKERLRTLEESLSHDLQFERERCQSIEVKLEESKQKIEEMNREEEALIEIFSEERCRRDNEEESLRNKLNDASNTIQGLLDKVVMLEKMQGLPLQCKPETR